MDYSDSLGRLLGYASGQMTRALNKALEQHGTGLTAEQFRVMTHLWTSDGITQTELAVKTMRDRATTTRILDLLERDGFVKREPDPTDRRIYRVKLTPTGKAIETKAQIAARQVIDQSTSDLTIEEVTQLKQLLKKLVTNLS